MAGATPQEELLLKYEAWARLFGALPPEEEPVNDKQTAEKVREDAADYAASANGTRGDPPSLERLEWLPELLREVIADRSLTAAEKVALMGEVNAAGMRFWAVAAEWSAGQRGVAMQKAETASEARARATGQEADSASARAWALRPEIPTGAPTLTGHKRVPEPGNGAEEDVA